MQKVYKVTVIIRGDYHCYREMFRGISQYSNGRAWQLDVCAPPADITALLKLRKPDGLLLAAFDICSEGRYLSDETKDSVRRVDHVVGVCAQLSRCGIPGLPEVESDDVAVGDLAAAHLLSKGFKHFGYMGDLGAEWSELRWLGYESRLAQSAHEPARFEWQWSPEKLVSIPAGAGTVQDWLIGQPKPFALFVCNDYWAAYIAFVCRELNLRVPQDVAILGVDNDPPACSLSIVPVSSVAIPWSQLGFKAAALLDQMMEGKHVEPVAHRMPPEGVIERQSTDIFAIEDLDVRLALQFIKEHTHNQITVDNVVASSTTTRRPLERKFRSLLGRTPLEEIRRAHLERAKLLLVQSDLSLNEIAKQSGYGSSAWMRRTFTDMVGIGPSEYRVQFHQTPTPSTNTQK